jgi:hypothetical protein
MRGCSGFGRRVCTRCGFGGLQHGQGGAGLGFFGGFGGFFLFLHASPGHAEVVAGLADGLGLGVGMGGVVGDLLLGLVAEEVDLLGVVAGAREVDFAHEHLGEARLLRGFGELLGLGAVGLEVDEDAEERDAAGAQRVDKGGGDGVELGAGAVDDGLGDGALAPEVGAFGGRVGLGAEVFFVAVFVVHGGSPGKRKGTP